MTITTLHEQELRRVIKELREDGYKVIDLERKSPDAIAVKDGKLIAIEILGMQYKKGKGWGHKWTYKAKQEIYHMFDEIMIKTFKWLSYK